MFKCQEGYTLRKIKDVSHVLPFGQQIADQRNGTVLNETGSFLWNVIQHNEGADLEMLTEMLARRYNLGEENFPMLREDIRDFLRQMQSMGMIIETLKPPIDAPALCVSIAGLRIDFHGPAQLFSGYFDDFCMSESDTDADQEIEFVITEFNPRRRRIIGDRKQLIVAEKKKLQEELFARIAVGDVVEGTVKNVTDFGAFIDLGGADGLLHISEMSWGRVENPKKVFKVGETVKVLIKDINGDKIALSLKFPEENPWLNAADKYAVGNVVEGCVARMTDFGAFVELEPGVDALLHVSQISREHVAKPSDALKIGQEITAKVVDFNEEDKKISLSMKALENEEPVEE